MSGLTRDRAIQLERDSRKALDAAVRATETVLTALEPINEAIQQLDEKLDGIIESVDERLFHPVSPNDAGTEGVSHSSGDRG